MSLPPALQASSMQLCNMLPLLGMNVSSGTHIRSAHMQSCHCRLCLRAVACAAQLPVIGRFGNVMIKGSGRRQRSMKQNTASCPPLGMLWYLRALLSDLTPHNSNVRESARWKQCNLRGVRSGSLYNLPGGGLCTFSKLTLVRASGAYKNLIIYFLTVTIITTRLRVRWYLITALLSFVVEAVKDFSSLWKNRGINVNLIQNTHPLYNENQMQEGY